MKISIDWLKTYLDSPSASLTADELEDMLTRQSFPIEANEPLEDGDALLDVEVTSNRPDCLSHVGLAREVAAGAGDQLKPPVIDLSVVVSGGVSGDSAVFGGAGVSGVVAETLSRVDNHEPQLCPLYTARVIQGVKIKPSPDWLQKRLLAVGLRPINNVVDVTNFVLHEMGQPLHAFDMNKLAERRIVVRCAESGESMTAIDGSKLTLDASMLVIADANKPVAVAGVMGGLDSEVGEKTIDILLESARFDPLSVRKTSRLLKLASDSSYRFERGVDPTGVELASRRAAALIVELAGGELAQGVIRVGEPAPDPTRVEMRIARCNQLLGVDFGAETMVDYLQRLQLSPALSDKKDRIICMIPTFRLDLLREVDLIEEVGRVHGLDRIAIETKMPIIVRPVQPKVTACLKLGDVLIAHGYHETITFSFIAPKIAKPFLPSGAEAVLLDDQRRKAESMLRPSLLPSLLACRKRNQDAGNRDVRLFETASIWFGRDGEVFENRKLAMLADAPDEAGEALRRMRGAIEELTVHLSGDSPLRFESTQSPLFQVGAEIRFNDQPIGTFGLLANKTQALFDLQTSVIAAELDLPILLDAYPPMRRLTALPRFPGIERDLSIVVDDAVEWRAVEQQVQTVEPRLLESVAFVTTWRGKSVGQGKKSVSFRLLFRDPQRTLRHDEVDAEVARVVDQLKAKLNAELRV